MLQPVADREIEITQALLEKVLVYDEAMTTACDVCAELDCLLAFAQASRANNYVRPTLTEENVIDIRHGRYDTHPLQLFARLIFPADMLCRSL